MRLAESALLPIGLPWLGAHFDLDLLAAMFLLVVEPRRRVGEPLRPRIRPPRKRPCARRAVLPAVSRRDESGRDRRRCVYVSAELGVHVAHVVGARDGASRRSRQSRSRIPVSRDGELRHVGVAAGVRTAVLRTGGYAFADIRALDHDPARAGLSSASCSSAAARRRASCRLHAWLPLAHPAAPSHVSALMSGVMTKVAIYGFVRIVFDLLGPPQTWWSVVVLSIGGITAVLGVLHAMLQDDLKRLLAYSTVENVGIVFIGLGLALAFESGGIHCGCSARVRRGAVSRLQPLVVQEPAVLRRRRGACDDARTRHGTPRRPDSPDAGHGIRVSRRVDGDFGVAAPQRIRFGVADVPGHSRQPATLPHGA